MWRLACELFKKRCRKVLVVSGLVVVVRGEGVVLDAASICGEDYLLQFIKIVRDTLAIGAHRQPLLEQFSHILQLCDTIMFQAIAFQTNSMFPRILLLGVMLRHLYVDLQANNITMSDLLETPVETPVAPPTIEPKPKRVLTEAQRLAFLKGREKRMANIEKRRQEKLEMQKMMEEETAQLTTESPPSPPVLRRQEPIDTELIEEIAARVISKITPDRKPRAVREPAAKKPRKTVEPPAAEPTAIPEAPAAAAAAVTPDLTWL